MSSFKYVSIKFYSRLDVYFHFCRDISFMYWLIGIVIVMDI